MFHVCPLVVDGWSHIIIYNGEITHFSNFISMFKIDIACADTQVKWIHGGQIQLSGVKRKEEEKKKKCTVVKSKKERAYTMRA